jgi:hypothetical protein
VGGELEVVSAPGQGTIIRGTVPGREASQVSAMRFYRGDAVLSRSET